MAAARSTSTGCSCCWRRSGGAEVVRSPCGRPSQSAGCRGAGDELVQDLLRPGRPARCRRRPAPLGLRQYVACRDLASCRRILSGVRKRADVPATAAQGVRRSGPVRGPARLGRAPRGSSRKGRCRPATARGRQHGRSRSPASSLQRYPMSAGSGGLSPVACHVMENSSVTGSARRSTAVSWVAC